jgi:hypothetical protein
MTRQSATVLTANIGSSAVETLERSSRMLPTGASMARSFPHWAWFGGIFLSIGLAGGKDVSHRGNEQSQAVRGAFLRRTVCSSSLLGSFVLLTVNRLKRALPVRSCSEMAAASFSISRMTTTRLLQKSGSFPSGFEKHLSG